MMRLSLPLLLALAVAAPAHAQPQTAPAARALPAPGLRARIDALPGILAGTGDPDSFFAPEVRAKLSRAQLLSVAVQFTEAHGPLIGIEGVEPIDAHAALVRVGYRDGVVTLRLDVAPEAPHLVIGLRIEGSAAREASLDQVARALDGLHGTTGYALAKLGGPTPQLLRARNADRAFAVGSAFKLVILAELVRATNAGERRWDDMVAIDGSQLPGGGYTRKPAGTQVSLRELATQMISISDNSATDLLLRALGREKVEAMLAVTGVRSVARNRPFLSTLEAFKLKYLAGGSYGRRYAALDEAGKRALLGGEMATIPLIAVDPAATIRPAMIEDAEWFLTPADLVRVMDWLRRNTEGPNGADARAILSKNPGILASAAAKWRWTGYKGGSETGVMNMTLLLHAKTGDWYVLTASWNDPAAPVSEGRFAALIGRAAELAAP